MSTEPIPNPSDAPEASRPRRRAWYYVWRVMLGLLIVLLLVVGGAVWYANTPGFENRVRLKLISLLEDSTGGRVELGAFRWRLSHLEAEADNLTIHGLEAPGEVPYAHVDRLYVRVKILSFLHPKIDLSYLEADRPVIHLILYPNGTTNQPTPKVKQASNTPVQNELLNLAIGRTVISGGMAIVNQRSILFDATANNVSAVVTYAPGRAIAHHPAGEEQDEYLATLHVEDLVAQRGKAPPLHSTVDVKADLGRNRFQLESLKLVTVPAQTSSVLASSLGLKASRTPKTSSVLNASGMLANFNHPAWNLKADGQFDVRELQALAQVPGIDGGEIVLSLQGEGTKSTFSVDGKARVRGAAYHVESIHLRSIDADTLLHVTQNELALNKLQARLPGGGVIDGSMRITQWQAATVPTPPSLPPATPGQRAKAKAVVENPNQQQALIQARIRGVSLVSVMSMIAPPRFSDLGFNSVASGDATVKWVGTPMAFVADAKMTLAPAGRGAGEVPLSGNFDAQYSNVSGLVTIRNFAAYTPATRMHISGALGVYPITRASQIQADVTTTNLGEFDHTLTTLGFAENGKSGVSALPIVLHGQAEFNGTISRSVLAPDVKGHLVANNVDMIFRVPASSMPAAAETVSTPTKTAGTEVKPSIAAPTSTERMVHWDSIVADAEYAPGFVHVSAAALTRGNTAIHLSGQIEQHRGKFDDDSPLTANVQVKDAAVADVLTMAGEALPVTGTINLNANVAGELGNLSGGGHVSITGGEIYGEPYHSLNGDLHFAGKELSATNLVFLQDGGRIAGSGNYVLEAKTFEFSAQGSGFDLAHFKQLQSEKYPISGALAFEAKGHGTVEHPSLTAHAQLANLNLDQASTGRVDLNIQTEGQSLVTDLEALLSNATIKAHATTQLTGGYQTQAHLTLGNLDVGPILQAFHVQNVTAHSTIGGDFTVSGPLRDPEAMSGEATLRQLAVSIGNIPLKSDGPLHATLRQGRLHLDPLHITGPSTDLHAQGSIGVFGGANDMAFTANGAVDVKLAQTFNPNLSSSGAVTFNIDADGTFHSPFLTGQVKFTNVSISMLNFPNGLSQLNGTLQFNQDRLDVKDLTAVSGGGLIKLGGFLTYQQGIYGDLTATAKGVRVRYPQGVSSMADASLRLQGTENSMLLSGNITVTRFVIGSDLDLSSFSSLSSVTLPPDPSAPSNHLRFDVHVVSAPQLDFQNSYAKLAGDVDLRVRGTLAQPSVLGHISVTEGTATFAGTKYELQHGDIYFTNPLRIEPTIDLSAMATVENYDVTIGLTGTPSKLTPTFRSEPPLSEQDIFSLLALGRTQEEQQIYSNEQTQAGVNSTADALLGGALNATVSSRIQKLFGGGSVKIDPTFVSGTGNSSARITVEQQISKNATLTYATNINSTAEQLIQGQVNLTQNVSVVAVRDESGVFSLIFQIRHRYR
jgi:translocation and assembly module TamB